MFDLLQITDTLNKVIKYATGDSNHDGHLSFFELLKMGGWIMVPLFIMLLFAVYVFAERTIAIRNAAKIDDNFMNIIRDNIVSGNVTAAEILQKIIILRLLVSLIKAYNGLVSQSTVLRKVWIMWASWKCINWKETLVLFL